MTGCSVHPLTGVGTDAIRNHAIDWFIPTGGNTAPRRPCNSCVRFIPTGVGNNLHQAWSFRLSLLVHLHGGNPGHQTR